jgi:translation initiation factor 3 subunit L
MTVRCPKLTAFWELEKHRSDPGPLCVLDQIFLILYRELYYRHVYSRLQPDIDDRFHSYENSCELFNYLLSKDPSSLTISVLFQPPWILDSDGPISLELPEQWLWDIIDEFIYQFQVFCTWRSKVKSKSDDELVMLADGSQVRCSSVGYQFVWPHPQVWSSYSVLNVLYSLIQKSKINEYMIAAQEGKTPEEIACVLHFRSSLRKFHCDG